MEYLNKNSRSKMTIDGWMDGITLLDLLMDGWMDRLIIIRPKGLVHKILNVFTVIEISVCSS